MELKEVIGRRRSIRFLRPYKPVERAKIQKMLEAARLASFWGNVQALGFVLDTLRWLASARVVRQGASSPMVARVRSGSPAR